MKSYFKLTFEGRKIIVKDYDVCASFFSKVRGLMFRIKPRSLLFVWKKPVLISIHSFFVFTSFVAVWYYRGKIVEMKLIKPWTFAVTPKVKFNKLLEIPTHSTAVRNI